MWSKYIPHFVKEGYHCYVMNLRSHYKSRVMDLTRVTFEDYLNDIREVIGECGELPILIGFSMGGILSQKIAETAPLSGLVLIDSCVCKEVNEIVPYKEIADITRGNVVPAPERLEQSSMDESYEDILFQKKYLAMESDKALAACSIPFGDSMGISVDSSRITCPCLVLRAINIEEDDKRGRAEAGYFHGEYTGFSKTTHTGLLIGLRYQEVVKRMQQWLDHLE
jgi:esterase/lipase